MARTRTNFRSYNSARNYARKLNLKTMRDWINFSQGKHESGVTRPKDIPSNPWTIYRSELESQGKKFSINEFLGSTKQRVMAKKPAKAVKMKTAVESGEIQEKKPRGRPKTIRVLQKSDASELSFTQAKSMVRKMHAKTRQDVNALVRMKLLPSSFPLQPSKTYKDKWKGWDDFLGNK